MAFGDILGGLLQGGGALGGYYLGGPGGAAVGNTLGQIGGDMARSAFKQENPQNQQLAQLMQQMQNPYQFQQIDFNPIAQAEQRRFNQQTVPGIAERFSGMGGQRSSAFRQQLGGAAGDLSSRLAELRAGHDVGQQQAGMQAYGMNQQRMGNLANLLQGQQQQQQAGREAQQNRYAQFAGMIPKTLMENQQFQQGQLNDYIKNQLLGVGQARQDQSGQQDFANRIGQWLTGQNTDTVSGKVPSSWENAGNAYMKTQEQALKALAQILPALF